MNSENSYKNQEHKRQHDKLPGIKNYESLEIYKFENPAGRNLCFSNAVTTILLNIQRIQDLLAENNQALKRNDIYRELKSLTQKENLSKILPRI